MSDSTSFMAIPPYIYCPRCGDRITLKEIIGDEKKIIEEQGYDAGARGICRCGVVLVICHQPLPKSPTFSIFIDVYKLSPEIYESIAGKN